MSHCIDVEAVIDKLVLCTTSGKFYFNIVADIKNSFLKVYTVEKKLRRNKTSIIFSAIIKLALASIMRKNEIIENLEFISFIQSMSKGLTCMKNLCHGLEIPRVHGMIKKTEKADLTNNNFIIIVNINNDNEDDDDNNNKSNNNNNNSNDNNDNNDNNNDSNDNNNNNNDNNNDNNNNNYNDSNNDKVT